jgi:hypothetical protein
MMPPKFRSRFLATVFLALTLQIARADCVALPDTSYYDLRDTLCSNQSIFAGNQLFDAANPSGTVVLPGAAADGGDSVIFVNLVFRTAPETTLNQSLCAGDTLWVNGTAYHADFYLGEEIVEAGAANGCDSIIHVNLTFHPIVFDYQETICEGDTVFVNGTAYHAYNPTGEEIIAGGGTAGCDSIIRINLQVFTPPYLIIADTLCPDDFLIVNGRRYDKDNRSGLEILPGAASNGCDSLVYLSLFFRELWIYLGENREVVAGDTVCVSPQFNLTPESLVWSPAPPCPDSICSSYCIQLLANASFTLTATDTSGCILTDAITFSVSDENRVFAPNVFNPDAAEPNNRFFLDGDDGVALVRRLLIADRWGGIVFDKENLTPGDASQGWDGTWRGKTAQAGVYTFWAELERIDGTRFEKAGTVSLVR